MVLLVISVNLGMKLTKNYSLLSSTISKDMNSHLLLPELGKFNEKISTISK